MIWASKNIESYSNVLTDLEVGGKLLVELAYNNKICNIYPFRYFGKGKDNNVLFLYSRNSTDANKLFIQQQYNYFVLSYKDINTYIVGSSWNSFKPIGDNMRYINNYSNFNKIYDDGYVMTYKYI